MKLRLMQWTCEAAVVGTALILVTLLDASGVIGFLIGVITAAVLEAIRHFWLRQRYPRATARLTAMAQEIARTEGEMR